MITGSFSKTFSFGATPASAPPAPPSYDPYYMGVSLLLHGDGSNGATTFIDSSFEPQNSTAFGNVQLNTSQYKFGTASMYFDGSGDYIQFGNNNIYDFGSGDFTIEMWIRPATVAGYHALIGYANGSAQNSNYAFQILHNGTGIQADIVTGNTQYTALAPGVLTLNTWTHVASVRSGNNWLLFVDGVLQATVDVTGVTNNNPAGSVLQIGQVQGYYPFNGYIDELRVTKGVARYTANFAVATNAFPDLGAPDLYFPDVVYLSHATGTNSSTAFVDSSSWSNTITATSPAVISTAKSKFGNASAYFNGTSGLLSSPTSTNFDLGNTYTAECWIYPLDTTYNAGILHRGYYTTGSTSWNGFTFSMRRIGSAIRFYFYATSAANEQFVDSASGSVVANTWQHVAMVRSGTTGYAFINGSLVGTITGLNSNSTSTQPLIIGNFEYSSNSSVFGDVNNNHFYGYIDEVRITKDVARYTTTFTVPIIAFSNYQNSSEDSYYSSVSLLLHADGANASTTFIDNSPTPKLITANGGASISTTAPKFGTGSGVFNGSTDYLSAVNSSDWVFGDSPFTVEAWIKTSTLPLAGGIGTITARGWGGVGAYSWGLGVANVSGAAKLIFLVSSNFDASSSSIIYSSSSVNTGEWIHVAGVRNGNTLRLFVNGIEEATAGFSGAVFDSSAPLGVGAGYYSVGTAWANYFSGNIDDLRITKGVARYTANFTIPSAAFSNSGPITDPYYSSVSLLLHGDGANTSTTFVDNSPSPKTPTVSGTTIISTTQEKFGPSSIYFPTNSYISYPDNNDFIFGSGDFCVEMWVYVPDDTTNRTFIAYQYNTGQSNLAWSILQVGNLFRAGLYGGPAGAYEVYTPASSVAANTWQYLAFVRNGTSLNLYLNGVSSSGLTIPSYASANSLSAFGPRVYVGAQVGTFLPINGGYIDDIRITKGVARYTSDFTPPIAAFPNS